MARLFYLENEIGERKDLNGVENIWLKNPTGLGINTSGNFADIRKGFFSRISGDIEPQGEIIGDLEFRLENDPYEDYRELVNWLSQDYELYFVYNPYGDREFYRTIEINYFTKTEKEFSGLLYVNFSFACLTPWYDFFPFDTKIDHAAAGYKRYDFSYNYTYPASIQLGTIYNKSTGHIPAAITLEYEGTLINPSITITGVDTGTEYGSCDISASLISTDKLIYSSRYGVSKVQKESAAGVITDLIGSVDISKNPFPKLPSSEYCSIVLSSSATIVNDADIKIYNYYRSV